MRALLNHSGSANGAVDEELADIRNRIVAISSKRRIAMSDIIQMGIVFTREELMLSHNSAFQRDDGSNPMAAAGVGIAANIASNLAADSSVCSTSGRAGSRRSGGSNNRDTAEDIPPARRLLPPGHQLRPDLPPDADDAWVEDEERRQSIPAQLKRDFVTSISASLSPASQTTASTTDAPQKRTTTWDLTSTRTFGVEMETLLSKRSDEFLLDNAVKAIRDVVPSLRTFLDSSYEVKFCDYQSSKDDRAYQAWKITTDLSIKSEDGRPIFGLEFITPKLRGPHDLWRLENFCEQLQALSFNVNSTTALHVHISAEDLTNAQLVRICQYAVVFEQVIDTFMTLPRRSDYSRYCRSNLKSMSISRDVAEAVRTLGKLDVSKSCGPLIRSFCPRLSAVRNSHRNHKINLLLLNRTRKGTPGRRIEFRQHQGSIDKVEIGAWVTLVSKWVEKCAHLPPPSPDEGNVQRFWQIIDDPKLRAYYTVKAQTLPSSMSFTYDSRELYAFETDEEEPSDIDDGDPDPTPAPPAPRPPAPHPPQQGPNGQAGSATSNTNSNASPLATRTAGSGVEVPSTPSPPMPPPSSTGGRTISSLPFGGRGDAFSTPPGSPASNAAVSTAAVAAVEVTPPTQHVAENMFLSQPRHSNSSASPPSVVDREHLGLGRQWQDESSSMASSTAPDPVIQAMRHMRRRGSFSMGNFVLPLPVQIETLLMAEAGDSWDQIVNTEPEIVCSEREDLNDNVSWFITAPAGRVASLRDGSMVRGCGAVRWLSPWLLEAKKLEQAAVLHDVIKESLLLDESKLTSVVSINVSTMSNAEITRMVVATLIFEVPMGELIRDPKIFSIPPPKDPKIFSKLVAELLKQGNAAQSVFPRSILQIVDKILTSSFFDMADIAETTQPSRGNFSLKRSLRFHVRSESLSELAYRCIFLSYMCNHIAKKCSDADLIRTAEVMKSPQRQDLVQLVSTLPTSVQRMLL